MDSACSFYAITGGRCGPDTREKTRSITCIPVTSCNRDICIHKASFALHDVDNEIDLILSRASIFTKPMNINQLVICPAHRAALGTGWKRPANEKCRIPTILSCHSDDVRKKPKAERGLCKAHSKVLLQETGTFLPVGSGKYCLYLFYFSIRTVTECMHSVLKVC